MEDFVEYTKLYDCYKGLLTEKECSVFEDYYFDNLSLQEIADNNNVSKSAIHKLLQSALDKIDNFEKVLNMAKKNDLLSVLMEEVSEDIKEKIKKIIEL